MRSLTTLLRSRVGIAVLGAVLLGGLGASMGAASVGRPGGTTSGSLANSSAIATNTIATSVSPTGSATPNPTDTAETGNGSPTATPGAPASRTPTTPPANTGQTIDLHGTITSINRTANTSTLNSTTVVINGQTQFQGKAASFQALQAGMVAEVKGQTQGDGSFIAFVVAPDFA